MASNIRPGWFAGLAVLAAAVLVLTAAGSGSAASRGCPSFESQADAQTYFLHHGGGPTDRVGKLDPDRDGVACEDLDAPYAGFANLGYNRRHDFFYGLAAMPEIGTTASGEAEYPCLLGNRHFDDGPRRLNVYRVLPRPDKPIFSREGIGTEIRDGGRLVWKAAHAVVLPGRYYAEFEERIRLHPYGENECPAFRSRVVNLP